MAKKAQPQQPTKLGRLIRDMSERDSSREGHAKCVCICGFAESYKEAPIDDERVEIWGLNELWKYLPRWNRWFEQHDRDTLGVSDRNLSEGEAKRHLEWLSKDHGKPIYMQPEFCISGRFPNATPYPLDEMCAMFGRYFTSTIGYMIALAIAEGFTWVMLAGVDLVSDVEYPSQRPNSEWLSGIVVGLGRTLVIPPSSAMLRAGHLYGYEQPIDESGGLRTAITNHFGNLKKKHDETLATLNTLEGAMQEAENTIKLIEYKNRGTHVETY